MKKFIDSSSIFGSILHRKFIDSDLKVHRILLSLVIIRVEKKQRFGHKPKDHLGSCD